MIFRNKNNQVRSGYKIMLFIILYIIFSFILKSITVGLIGGYTYSKYGRVLDKDETLDMVTNYLSNSSQGLLISQITNFIVLMLVLFIVLKLIEKKKMNSIGLKSVNKHSKQLLYGLALGALSIVIIVIVMLATGNIQFQNSFIKPEFGEDTTLGIALFIIVSMNEEILCRGYIYNTLNQMNRPWIAACISSAAFALLHVTNPNVNFLAMLNIFLVGILFCFMYMKTKSLWMGIGFHFTWNYFQGNVFGIPVSGLSDLVGIYNIQNLKSNVLTGGIFGVEAGLLTTIIIILNFWALYTIYKRRKCSNVEKIDNK